MDTIRDRIAVAAEARAAELRDFAATLVGALLTPAEGLLLHVGDGAAVLEERGRWSTGSWPAAGEYASMTFFVTDDPEPQLRITRLKQSPEGIALFTDGIERLVLNFATQEPHQPFFEAMIRSVRASAAAGRDANLSQALSAYLDSDAVNARTDDDKTLILAVQR